MKFHGHGCEDFEEKQLYANSKLLRCNSMNVAIKNVK